MSEHSDKLIYDLVDAAKDAFNAFRLGDHETKSKMHLHLAIRMNALREYIAELADMIKELEDGRLQAIDVDIQKNHELRQLRERVAELETENAMYAEIVNKVAPGYPETEYRRMIPPLGSQGGECKP